TALGHDTVVDSSGTDTLDFSASSLGVNVDLSRPTPQTVNAHLTLTLSSGRSIENIIGGSGNDRLRGNGLDNHLQGGLGDDTYRFKADSPQGTDTIVDAGGSDTLDFSSGSLAVTVDLSLTGVQTVNPNLILAWAAGTDIENAIGTSGNDILMGNALNNRLE